jgi:hypothetical protein
MTASGRVWVSGTQKDLLIIAIIDTLTGDVTTIPPEGYPRADTNLTLLTIGINIIHRNGNSE